MSMSAGFLWVDKTQRKSCHRRNNSSELDVFEAERYFSAANENLGHRGTTLSQKIGLPTKESTHVSSSSRQNWRELGRASLDIPIMRQNHHHNLHHTLSQSNDTNLDTINPITKDKIKKHKNPSSPGGKLASFFNSLISQAVSKKKKTSKSSPQSVKDLVEEESPSAWRRMRRRSSISHFRSSANSTTSSISATFASRKPNNSTITRPKRTSMSDIETKSIGSCSNVSKSRTPPPYINKNTPIKPYRNTNISCHVAGSDRKSSSQEIKEFKRFVEEDGADSDSSSDLFELKLNYDHPHLGYCGGGLPVYETTRMDSIKIASGTPITNGPFRNT